MSTRLEGIFAAAVTPVNGEGEISDERFAVHCRWLLHNGCHGVVVFGTTGEAPSFSVAERQRALENLLASGIAPERVILGIGCCARADTVALARHGLELGVRRFLVMPPFFFKEVSEEGVIRSYLELADGLAGRPAELLLYHFPQMSAVPITHGVIARLLESCPGVIRGIKDSSGDRQHTLELIRAFPSLAVFSGDDKALLACIERGGAGIITAGANLTCAESREAFDRFREGDLEAASKAMARVEAVREILEAHPMIAAIKRTIADAMRDPEWSQLRPPLLPLDEERAQRLARALEAVDYAYEPEAFIAASA